ncbi:MAG: DUF871 domain-containing protein [Anaerorhabdus sp.]
MRKLGISIYPDLNDIDKIKDYVQKAGELGYGRIFVSLLQVKEFTEELTELYRDLFEFAHHYNFEIFADVNPMVLKKMGGKKAENEIVQLFLGTGLKDIKKLGVDGLRLDMGSSPMADANQTQNQDGVIIEFNSSMTPKIVDSLMPFGVNRHQMAVCHNFYPRKYTGLDLDFYKECNKVANQYGIRSAVFISSQNKNTNGPWPVAEGLCTVEDHRFLPVETQVAHILAMDDVDDIIFANYPASDEELKLVANLDRYQPTLNVLLDKDVTSQEKEILFNQGHFVRGDISGRTLRAMTRMFYTGADIPARNTKDIHKGDIIIDNNDYGQYKGDMHIALRDMKNDGKSNVVGRVREDMLMVLDELKPFGHYRLVEQK